MQTATVTTSLSVIRPEMIELRRRMLGISQTELANRVGIAQGTLSKIEQGLKEVTEEFVDRLSQALNCHRSFFPYQSDYMEVFRSALVRQILCMGAAIFQPSFLTQRIV